MIKQSIKPALNKIFFIDGKPTRFIKGTHQKKINIRKNEFEPEFILIPIFNYRIFKGKNWRDLKTTEKLHN